MAIMGFMQEAEVDNFNMYSPTRSDSSTRLLTALVVKRIWSSVTSISNRLSSRLLCEKERALGFPPGCGYLTEKLVRLDKSLHSLKQASHEFQQLLTSELID